VLVNRADHLKVAVYSFADEVRTGRMRVWALEHGRYRLSVGPDADGDFSAESSDKLEELTVVRADAVKLTLAPRAITLVELRQLETADPIYQRPDLALAEREIEIRDGLVHGVAHNVGAANVKEVVVALVDASGNTLARQTLGSLPAPLDLVPKRKPFAIAPPRPPRSGWRLLVDPDHEVAEIYEGNNEAPLPRGRPSSGRS
jgi:hypothetical protein